MEHLLDYSSPLISVPEKKVNEIISRVIEVFSDDKAQCSLMIDAIHRYASANIPVDYWFLDMKDFVGDKILLKKYNDIVYDIEKIYDTGKKYCFAGTHGLGKTMVISCVLRKAVETGYSALYITLADIVNIMASRDEEKYDVRKILMEVDFLAVDEFDPRFMGSENAADLYGRIIEPILRTRIQNTLPLLMCTNSTDPVSGFSGPLKHSIKSLMSLVEIVPVLGKDFRAVKEKK
jgi:DNA replication protein DnaC